MTSPVGGVWRKIERADQHIKDLDRLRHRFGDEKKSKAVLCQVDPEDPEYVVWRLVDTRVPDGIRLILGDAVHNLRSALDYLVDILVRANEATPGTYTAFPVWRKRGVPGRRPFGSLVAGKVRGVAPEVAYVFNALEAYEGGAHQALWTLDQLDILDKHRLPLLVTTCIAKRGVRVRVDNPDYSSRPVYLSFYYPTQHLKDGDVLGRLPRRGEPKLDDRMKFAFDIALGEPEVLRGELVIPALAQMRKAVIETVREFRVFL
jgi:hypothetical protein